MYYAPLNVIPHPPMATQGSLIQPLEHIQRKLTVSVPRYIHRILALKMMYSETCDKTTTQTTESGLIFYETGGLSSQVQMYRNVRPCYCNSGLSSDVGLSLQWSLIAGFTVNIS